jgi:hypothetical protein
MESNTMNGTYGDDSTVACGHNDRAKREIAVLSRFTKLAALFQYEMKLGLRSHPGLPALISRLRNFASCEIASANFAIQG